MGWIGRRRRELPAELAEMLGVAGGDRVLAWSELAGGGVAAATVTNLKVFTPRGRLIDRPWFDVEHAAWDEDSRTLAVFWVGSRQTTPLELTDEGSTRLAVVVRERVQASVVLTVPVPLPGGRTARIALRQAPDGTVVTQSIMPPGVRADAPEIAPLLARAAAAARAEVGLP